MVFKHTVKWSFRHGCFIWEMKVLKVMRFISLGSRRDIACRLSSAVAISWTSRGPRRGYWLCGGSEIRNQDDLSSRSGGERSPQGHGPHELRGTLRRPAGSQANFPRPHSTPVSFVSWRAITASATHHLEPVYRDKSAGCVSKKLVLYRCDE